MIDGRQRPGYFAYMTRLGWVGPSLVAALISVAPFHPGAALAQEERAAESTRSSQPEEDTIDTVPDGQKAGVTGKSLTRMRELLTQAYKHLEEARNEKDVVKLTCVNTKLTRLKGLLKIAEQADVAMQEGVARRDSETADHEFEKIILAHRKVEQLLAEIEACVGELAVYAGDTEVELELQGVPKEDPLEAPTNIVLPEEVVRPAPASPYQ